MFSNRYLWTFLIIIFILLDMTFLKRITIFEARPDLTFILIIFAGITNGFLYGAGLGFAGGLIKDIFLNIYLGIDAFALTLTGFLAGSIGKRVFCQNIVIQVIIMFIATLIKMGVNNVLLIIIHHPPYPCRAIFSQAFFNAFLTPPLFLLLGLITQITKKDYTDGK